MLPHIKDNVSDPTRDGTRYGPRRRWRFPWTVRFQWPLRTPIMVERVHRFDVTDSGETAHSARCWCRTWA